MTRLDQRVRTFLCYVRNIMHERIFAIGDIHGCRTHLVKMLDLIPWDPAKDRILFLGDYIDRGSDSKGVIEIVEQVKREYPQTVLPFGQPRADVSRLP